MRSVGPFLFGKWIIGRFSSKEWSAGGAMVPENGCVRLLGVMARAEIGFYLQKEFRAAEIRFYLHKDFRAAGIEFYLHKELCMGGDPAEKGKFQIGKVGLLCNKKYHVIFFFSMGAT